MYRFNKRPVKGMKTLISSGLVANSPEAVAKFICEEPGLSRSAVGDFFGEADEFSQQVLQTYSANFDFTDASLDQSLRLFLLSFRIPGTPALGLVLSPSCVCMYTHALSLLACMMR